MPDEDLVLNPLARLHPVEDGRGLAGFRVFAPIRGRGAQHEYVGHRPDGARAAKIDPALVTLLQRMYEAGTDVEPGDGELEQLQGLGLIIRSSEVSTPVRYACVLEHGAAPPSGVASQIAPGELADAVVDPSLRIASTLEPPDDGLPYGELFHCWTRDLPVAWVTDWRTGASYPYQLDSALYDTVASLRPGEPPPPLSEATARVLAEAGILTPRDSGAVRRRWDGELARVRACYRDHGYAILPGIIPPLHLAALARYYHKLIDEGFMSFGDLPVSKRYWCHSEEVMRFFHLQLCRFFADIMNTAIKPSYCYLGSYRPGAALARHTDREQCEYSASIQVDFTPYRGGACGWKLFVEKDVDPKQTFTIDLGLGDGVLFRGRELAHFRDPLPEGQTSTSFFLHYVPESFTGRLY